MRKTCTGCKKEKLLEEFHKHKRGVYGRNARCKRCVSEDKKSKYRNDPVFAQRVKSYHKKYQEVVKKKVYGYLLEHPCVDCGEPDPVVLDFDHVRGDKVMPITKCIGQHNWSWKRLQTEIAKCDVRCSNCHRRKTAKQLSWYSFMAT